MGMGWDAPWVQVPHRSAPCVACCNLKANSPPLTLPNCRGASRGTPTSAYEACTPYAYQ